MLRPSLRMVIATGLLLTAASFSTSAHAQCCGGTIGSGGETNPPPCSGTDPRELTGTRTSGQCQPRYRVITADGVRRSRAAAGRVRATRSANGAQQLAPAWNCSGACLNNQRPPGGTGSSRLVCLTATVTRCLTTQTIDISKWRCGSTEIRTVATKMANFCHWADWASKVSRSTTVRAADPISMVTFFAITQPRCASAAARSLRAHGTCSCCRPRPTVLARVGGSRL